MNLVPWFVAAYFLGSIPTSWLVVKLVTGKDLRELGSGNLGATNLYRQLGWKWAIPAAIIDVAKGAIPVLVFAPEAGGGPLLAALLGITAVLGHVFSVFVKFKGGKGVATGAGVMLGFAPWAVLASAALWGLIVRLTGYVSLGSIVAAAALPLAVWLLHPERRDVVWVFGLLALMIIVLHRANIKRLMAGTEHRFGRPAAT
ncbi:MAG TPA: glycerol-3-phosphate 1-O-acyltransferase PlsY [Gemmatimonadales bacterium]|nr:glycerol-3-phosphate 1-O-acyltransferase PlsY [Gemmatimonadales bacterium]